MNKLFVIGNDLDSNLFALVAAKDEHEAVKRFKDVVKPDSLVNNKFIGHDTLKYIQMPTFFTKSQEKNFKPVDEFWVREIECGVYIVDNFLE